MSTRPAPLLATDRTAALLMDMKPAEFRALVESGYLPAPKDIGGLKRWVVEDLRRIAWGDAVEEGIKW